MRLFQAGLLGVFFAFGTASAAEFDNLYPLFSHKSLVKICVSPLSDETGKEKKADPADLKKKLEEALAARKSIRFQVVPKKEEAEIVVMARITEMVWMEKDPVDMFMGIGSAVMDAVIQEHYARMEALFTVQDAKTNQVLWEEKLKATVTHPTMSKAESVPMVDEDMVKVFLRECFGKRRR